MGKRTQTDIESQKAQRMYNVLDSDGTVIISHGFLTGGSALIREFAIRHEKPWIHLDMKILTRAYTIFLLLIFKIMSDEMDGNNIYKG